MPVPRQTFGMGAQGVPQGIPPTQNPRGGLPAQNTTKAPTMVAFPMGSINPSVRPDAFQTFYRGFRKKSDPGMYNPTVTPSRPFIFSVGSFKVPQGMALILTDYQIRAAGFSGVAAGATRALPPETMGTSWSFSLTLDASTPYDVQNDIEPTPIQVGQQGISSIDPRTGAISTYALNAGSAVGVATGQGRVQLPFRNERIGPRNGPFTIIAPTGQSLNIGCAIIRPLALPVAYVEADFGGYLVPQRVADQYMVMLNP